MALENVVDGIRAEARREADSELEKARLDAAEITARAQTKASEIRDAKTRDASSAVEMLRRRELAAAELESRRLRLTAEKELLSAVRAEATSRLAALAADTRAKHLKALASRFGGKDGRLYVSTKDKSAAEKIGTVAGTIETSGGVVIESKDGSTREDLRYETILDEVWQERLREVADVLLGK